MADEKVVTGKALFVFYRERQSKINLKKGDRMNKEDFLRELEHELLSLDEYERADAISYYVEFFDEAGVENEAQVLEELGSPKHIAAQIKAESAFKKANENPQNVKKNMHAFWVGLGAVCAAPIAVPLIIVGIAVLLVFFIVLCALLGSLFICAFAFAICAVIFLISSIFIFFMHPPTALLVLGAAFILAGLFGFLFFPTLMLSRVCFRGLASLVNRYVIRRKIV